MKIRIVKSILDFRLVLLFMLPLVSISAKGYTYPEELMAQRYLVRLSVGARPVLLYYTDYVESLLLPNLSKGKYNSYENAYKLLSERGKYFYNDQAFSEFYLRGNNGQRIRFEVTPDKEFAPFLELITKGDLGEACASFSNYDVNKKIVYPTPSDRFPTNPNMRNIPVSVVRVINVGYRKEAILQEELDLKNVKFTDWKAYFHDGEKFRDPSIRLVWVTSWDDISERWSELLRRGNSDEVLLQMKIISESGRFKLPGGEAWRANINNFMDKNGLVPSVQIISAIPLACDGEIDWGGGKKTEIKNLTGSQVVSFPLDILSKLETVEAGTATVRLWVPNQQEEGIVGENTFSFCQYGENQICRIENNGVSVASILVRTSAFDETEDEDLTQGASSKRDISVEEKIRVQWQLSQTLLHYLESEFFYDRIDHRKELKKLMGLFCGRYNCSQEELLNIVFPEHRDVREIFLEVIDD